MSTQRAVLETIIATNQVVIDQLIQQQKYAQLLLKVQLEKRDLNADEVQAEMALTDAAASKLRADIERLSK